MAGHAGIFLHYCDVSSSLRNQNICWLHYPQTYLLSWTGTYSQSIRISKCKNLLLNDNDTDNDDDDDTGTETADNDTENNSNNDTDYDA